jgi:hypothetical protein
MFTVPVGSYLWAANQHEPIVVTLICPLLLSRPWQVWDIELVVELRHQMSGVWSADLAREWSGLHKFWTDVREWPSV